MPRFGPIKRRKFISNLRELGFTGPYQSGGRGPHQEYMVRGTRKVPIPNTHGDTINDVGLIKRILREADVSDEDWQRLP